MNIQRTILISLFTCITYTSLNAQQKPTSCLVQLKDALSKEKQKLHHIFDKGACWHLKMLTISEVLNEETKKYESHIENGEITAGLHMRYTKGNNIEVFADDHDVFTVNSESNTVLHTPSNPAYLKIKDDSYLAILQDTIFNLMDVTDCTFKSTGTMKVQSFSIRAKKLRSPYNKMTIEIDTGGHKISKVHIEMNPLFQKEIKEISIATKSHFVVPL